MVRRELEKILVAVNNLFPAVPPPSLYVHPQIEWEKKNQQGIEPKPQWLYNEIIY